MKRLVVLLTIILIVSPALLPAQEALNILPAKPKAGEKISITYNTTGTELFGIPDPEAVAYLLEGGLPIAKEIKLAKKGNIYSGEFTTNDTTRAIFISFSKDDKRDNNGDKGYYSMIYATNGQPVTGARKAMGQAYGSFGGIWGLKRDQEAALRWSREELAANPGLQQNKPLEFAELLSGSTAQPDLDNTRKALESVVNNPASTEADLNSAKMQFENKFKDKSKSTQIDSIIKKRYPSGNWVKTSIRDEAYKEKDPLKQTELFGQLKKLTDPNNDQDKRLLSSVAYSIATNFANAGEFEKTKEYAGYITEKSARANLFNSIAWKETGGSIDGKPGNLAIAKELSAQSLDLVREMRTDVRKKPTYRTEAEFLEDLGNAYTMYSDTYALLLYHSQEYQQAYDIQKKAVEASKGKDVSMNEAFAAYTEKIKGAETTINILEGFVKEGRYSPKMKEQLKRLYLAQNKTVEAWNEYIAGLEAFSLERKRQELAKKMINEAAPAFVLKDIKGSEVTLASLKGKIVIVDFWATWCGPCKASFPGMKMAVEKYKDDPNVKFVFIDTWENGEKDLVKKNVADFIEKNAYPFHVLMDFDSKTVEAFKVDGIPTKFVIDTNSKIRFRSVGFGGSAEGLASEVGMMIEMARSGDAGAAPKKAF